MYEYFDEFTDHEMSATEKLAWIEAWIADEESERAKEFDRVQDARRDDAAYDAMVEARRKEDESWN